jgi:hypothetical protein
VNNIAAAFIKAKKEFAPAMKTSTNPHYKSKYADLAACVEAVDDAFLNSGIVMYQETFEDVTGVTVETVLLHESGESIRCGKLHVPAPKQDPQGYGSALSYARRYSLMAACGIAPEDDDGNSASKTHMLVMKPSELHRRASQPAVAPAQSPVGGASEVAQPPVADAGSTNRAFIIPVGRDKGKTLEEVDDLSWIKSYYEAKLETQPTSRYRDEWENAILAIEEEEESRG